MDICSPCNKGHVKNRKVFTIFFKIISSFRQMIECCTNSSQSPVLQVEKSVFRDKRASWVRGGDNMTTNKNNI